MSECSVCHTPTYVGHLESGLYDHDAQAADKAKADIETPLLAKVRAMLVTREQDLRWCGKDDDCEIRAESVAVVIADFDYLFAEPTGSQEGE